jgi:hypothetical protein
MLPVPASFQPEFEEFKKHIRWSHVMRNPGAAPVTLELGMRRAHYGDAQMRAALRNTAWQALELVRIGRLDLLQGAMQDRHKRNRPVSKPGVWTPTPDPAAAPETPPTKN